MSEHHSTFGQSLPSLGQQVRSWRRAFAMTQAELEQAAGMSHNLVSRIECGIVSPRLDTLERLAKALNVSVEQLQFQRPQIRAKEEEAQFGVNSQVDALCDMLAKVPEPKKSMLIRTFQDMTRMVIEDDNE